MDPVRPRGGVSPRVPQPGGAVSPRGGSGAQYGSRLNDPTFSLVNSPLVTQWAADMVAQWEYNAAKLAADAQAAIAAYEAGKAGGGEGGDFQTLADEMGVGTKREKRAQRRNERSNTAGPRPANGGTVTTGDVGTGATLSVDVSGGSLGTRRRGV